MDTSKTSATRTSKNFLKKVASRRNPLLMAILAQGVLLESARAESVEVAGSLDAKGQKVKDVVLKQVGQEIPVEVTTQGEGFIAQLDTVNIIPGQPLIVEVTTEAGYQFSGFYTNPEIALLSGDALNISYISTLYHSLVIDGLAQGQTLADMPYGSFSAFSQNLVFDEAWQDALSVARATVESGMEFSGGRNVTLMMHQLTGSNGAQLIAEFQTSYPELYDSTNTLVRTELIDPDAITAAHPSAAGATTALAAGLGGSSAAVAGGAGAAALAGAGGGGSSAATSTTADPVSDANSTGTADTGADGGTDTGTGGDTNPTPVLLTGTVVDDAVVGATVFWDLDGNHIQNGEEVSVTTDAHGHFQIGMAPSPEAVLIATGGFVDLNANGIKDAGEIDFTGIYTLSQTVIDAAKAAGADDIQINPLTHLMSQADQELGADFNLDQALATLIDQLGLRELFDQAGLNEDQLLTIEPGVDQLSGNVDISDLSALLLKLSQDLGQDPEIKFSSEYDLVESLVVAEGEASSGLLESPVSANLSLEVSELPEFGSVTIVRTENGFNYSYQPDDAMAGGVEDSFVLKISDGFNEPQTEEIIVQAIQSPGVSVEFVSESTATTAELSFILSDGSFGEDQFVVVTLPEGAQLSTGIPHPASGGYLLTASDLTDITLTIAPGMSFPVALGVSAFASLNGVETAPDQPVSVTIEAATAATPELVVTDTTAVDEDNSVDLSQSVVATLSDNDGSEILSIEISGLPDGAALNNGLRNPDGIYLLNAGDLADLAFIPAAGQDGEFILAVTAISRELASGDTSSSSANLTVTVDPIATEVAATFANIEVTSLDEAVELTISSIDSGDDDTVSAYLSGIPEGVTVLVDGQPVGEVVDGRGLKLSLADLQDASLQLVDTVVDDFQIGVEFEAQDSSASSISNSTIDVTLDLPPVAPTVAVEVAGSDLNIALTAEGDFSSSISGLSNDAQVLYKNEANDWVSAGQLIQGAEIQIAPGFSYHLPATFYIDTSIFAVEGDGWTQNFVIKTAVAADLTGLAVSVTANGLSSSSDSFAISSLAQDAVLSDPLVIDLAGDGYDLTDVNSAPVSFDIDNDGAPNTTAWIGASDAVLVHDKNSDGVIDSADEVFSEWYNGGENSDNTVPFDSASAALATLDTNGNGVVDDAELSEVSVWQDANQNGVVDAGEMQSAADFGIAAISLDMADADADVNGNLVLRTGTITLSDNNTLEFADVALRYHQSEVEQGQIVPELALTPVVTGTEDGAVDLQIALQNNPGFGLVIISGVENGTLNMGAAQQAGGETFYVLPSFGGSYAGLQFIPDDDFSGEVQLQVTGYIADSSGVLLPSPVSPLIIDVQPVADAPELSTQDALTNEDSAIALTINVAAVSPAGDELLTLVVAAIPDEAELALDGITLNIVDNAVTLSGSELELVNQGLLTFMPPANLAGEFVLQVSAVSAVAGTEAITDSDISITVQPDADQPIIELGDLSGLNNMEMGNSYALPVSVTTVDDDGSEALYVKIDGMPDGALLSHGYISGASWFVNVTDLPELSLQVLQPINATQITITAYSVDSYFDTAEQQTAIDLPGVAAPALPVADQPITVSLEDLQVVAGRTVELDLSGIGLNDLDGGDESLSVQISGLPQGVVVLGAVSTGNGSYLLEGDLESPVVVKVLNENLALADVEITVTAIAREASGSVTSSGETLNLTVVPEPEIAFGGLIVKEDEPFELPVILTNAEPFTVELLELHGMPEGSQLFSNGAEITAQDGVFDLANTDLNNLVVQLPANGNEDFILVLNARFELSGTVVETGADKTISVIPENDAPIVDGVITVSTDEDTELTLDQLFSNVFDPDTGSSDGLFIKSVSVDNGAVELAGDLRSVTYSPDQDYYGPAEITYILSDGVNDLTATASVTVNAVDDPAVVSGDFNGTVTEDSQLTATGVITISDVDDSPEFADDSQVGSYGTLELTAGEWTYTLNNSAQALNADQVETENFILTATDGTEQIIEITVTGTEDEPVVTVNDSGDVAEDGTLTATGLISISDADSADSPVFEDDSQDGTYGTLELTDGEWTFTLNNVSAQALNQNQVETESFTLTATDGTQQIINITVAGTEDAPVVTADDSGAITEDAAAQTATGSVAISDADDADSPVFADDSQQGIYGLLELTGGNWTYTLDNNQAQELNDQEVFIEHFVLTASDSTEQVIDITVTGTQDAPEVALTVTSTEHVTEDSQPTETGTLTISDADAEDAPNFTDQTIAGQYGSLELVGDNWTYTLDERAQALNDQQQVTESFTLVASDDTEQVIEIAVTGTQDEPEVALTVTSVGPVTEDSQPTASGTLNISDADAGDAPTFTDQTLAGQYGSLVLIGENWSYTLDERAQALNDLQQVSESFTLVASDDTEQVIEIAVTGTQDAPEVALTVTSAEPVIEDSQPDASGTLTISDADVEDAPTFADHTLVGLYGSLQLVGESWSYTLDDRAQALNDQQQITESFTLVASDDTEQVIEIAVTGTQDAPEVALTVTSAEPVIEDSQPAANGTLIISDADAQDAPTFADQTLAGQYGSLQLVGENWSYTLDDRAQALNDQQQVSESFTLVASDDTEQVIEIAVTGTQDAPDVVLTVTSAESVTEDSQPAASGTLTISDADAEDAPAFADQTLAGQYGSLQLVGESWSYTLDDRAQALNDQQQVTESFTLVASDDTEQVIEIAVTGTQDAPEVALTVTSAEPVIEDSQPAANGTLIISDADAEDAPAFADQTLAGQYGSLQLVGENWSYTLDERAQALNDQQQVTESFTLVASDDTEQVITVSVTGAGDAPVAADDAKQVSQNATNYIRIAEDLLSNDNDVDSADTPALNNFAQPSYGTLALVTLEDGTQALEYIPEPDYTGPDSFTYEIVSGGEMELATVTLDVVPNIRPETGADELNGTEEQVINFTATDLLSNDSDADSDPVSISSYTQPENGMLVDDGEGNFTYTPDQDFNGTDSFSYTVTDGRGGEDTATVAINVAAVQDIPVAVADTLEATEDQPLNFTAAQLLGNDSDADQDDLTILSVGQPAHGELADDGEGGYIYTPDADFNGNDSFTYTISDGEGGESQATVTVNVAAVQDAPVAAADTLAATEDQPLNFTAAQLLGNDSDVDQDDLTILSVGQPAHGELTDDGEGGYTYTPDADFSGNDSFSYTISDGQSGESQATVTVNVAAVQDAPVAAADTLDATEDQPLNFTAAQLLGNDSDVDQDDLTILSVGQPAHGELTDDGDGGYTYTPDADFNGNDSFSYTITDGQGGEHSATVAIDVAATPDDAIVSGVFTGEVTEDDVFEASGSISITDADSGENPIFNDVTLGGQYGEFDLVAGDWTYTLNNFLAQDLDEGQQATEAFDLVATDGTEQSVEILVNGVEDLPSIYFGSVIEDQDMNATGYFGTFPMAEGPVYRGALGEYGSIQVRGDHATGQWEWFYQFGHLGGDWAKTNGLNEGEVVYDSITLSTESNEYAGKTITIMITGTDDHSVVSGGVFGDVAEDGISEVSEAIYISDVDTLDDPYYLDTLQTGIYGSFELIDGVWTYRLDQVAAQTINSDDAVETFTVTASDGTERVITIDIQGNDDAAEISGDISGVVTEDSLVQVSGELLASDIDSIDPVFSGRTYQGQYGSLVMQGGTWTYTLEPTLADTFNSNDVAIVDSFQVLTSHQGISETVTITINGSDDGPALEGAMADTSAKVSDSWLYSVPDDLFSDVDSDFSLSATLHDGSELPEWISFNAETAEFSIAEGMGRLGSYELKVIAIDALDSSLQAETTFTLAITPLDIPDNLIIAEGEAVIGDASDNLVYAVNAGNTISGGAGDDVAVLAMSDAAPLNPAELIHGGSGADTLAVAGIGSNDLNIDAVILDFNKTEGDRIDLSLLRDAGGNALTLNDLAIQSTSSGFEIDLTGLTTVNGGDVTGTIEAIAIDSASNDWSDAINLNEQGSVVSGDVLAHLDDLYNNEVV